MKQLFIYLWTRIPPNVKILIHGALVVAEGAAYGFIFQYIANPGPLCFTRACLKQFAVGILGAVVAALRLWFKPQAKTIFADIVEKSVKG